MKEIVNKILKGLLVLVLVALLLLLIFGAVLLIGWPWWVGIFILLGVIGLGLAALVLRKFLKRRSEQMFVQQVIAQDEAGYRSLSPKEQDTAKELQARWKEAIEALRKSHLRKFGNPLYVLPWYMVIGESGTGKTTAIQSARLSSPFADVSRTSGISGTRNCDWWFFEQAILIDTAGRYAVPVNQGDDKDEWQTFLKLLAKFRKKEPLNGLVVTIAADQLAEKSLEVLAQEGQNIRRRIDELMRVLGAKFPVYLMVTKCDLIQGAARFCELLPEQTLNQAMGLLNEQLSADMPSFTDQVFRTVGERLRDLRLLLLNQTAQTAAASTPMSMMLFPDELEKLHDSLAAFIAGAFKENSYQETPLLRGVYFSSGRQEGTPFSHFLKALGLIQGAEVLAGTSKGLFLHDFFQQNFAPRPRPVQTHSVYGPLALSDPQYGVDRLDRHRYCRLRIAQLCFCEKPQRIVRYPSRVRKIAYPSGGVAGRCDYPGSFSTGTGGSGSGKPQLVGAPFGAECLQRDGNRAETKIRTPICQRLSDGFRPEPG